MSDLIVTRLPQNTSTLSRMETRSDARMEVRVHRTPHDLEVLQRQLNRAGQPYNAPHAVPAVLQRFFTGEIDLDTELGKRFTGSPLLSSIDFRPPLPEQATQGTATLTTQDDAASLIIDVHQHQGTLDLSFTLGAMLSLHFALDELGDIERRRWLDLMRREQGVAFLWSAARWERDYLIFVLRKYQIRAYAFSPRRFEAAVHLTPEVTHALLDWLENYWF